jgi:hypothetical protein
MILPFLLLQTTAASPLAVRPDTARPLHDARHYEITLVLGDSGHHVLGEIETSWRLRRRSRFSSSSIRRSGWSACW